MTRDKNLSFSEALHLLKHGTQVCRAGWNGKGMFLFMVPGSVITVETGRPLALQLPVGSTVCYQPHIDMFTAQGTVVPWLASQTDLLADDWEIVSDMKVSER